MISIACAFASGVIASGLTALIWAEDRNHRNKWGSKLKLAWSRVLPLYGVALALLIGASYAR